jgi:hypothetical protein
MHSFLIEKIDSDFIENKFLITNNAFWNYNIGLNKDMAAV